MPRTTEEWPDNYESMRPITIGDGQFSQFVVPLETTTGQLIKMALQHLGLLCIFFVFFGVLALGAAAWLHETHEDDGTWALMFAYCLIYAAFAAWVMWRTLQTPRRHRQIVSRDGAHLAVASSAPRYRPGRLDLSAARYAWIEPVFRKQVPIGWQLNFGPTPVERTSSLSLPHLDSNHFGQYLVYDQLLRFVGQVFDRIEPLSLERRKEIVAAYQAWVQSRTSRSQPG